jgi:TP901 family phage tail tape measure protein
MGLGGEIGKAFVGINPDLKPMAGVGGKIKAIMSNPITGVATAAIGVGVALLEVGNKFQASFNAIARGTGATGDQLAKLKGDFKTVLAGTAGSFEQVQQAIIGVNRATGLTGPPLDQMAKQFVTLARITKTDVAGNIAATEPLFAKFNIAAKDQGAALDVLFKASQFSGKSVAELADQVKGGATVLKDFGYSFAGSTALIAEFDKAGVNADAALSAMKKGFASFAKAGEDPQKAMSALVASIKSAPSEAEATGMALKVFGAKAGAELVTAIRSGKLNVDELTKSLASGKDGILATAKATPTLSGAFGKMKNQLLVAIEPMATKLLELVTVVVGKMIPAFNWLLAAVGPPLRQAVAWFKANFETLKPILIAVGAAIVLLVAPIPALVAGIIYAYTHFKVLRDVVKAVADFLSNVVAPAISGFVQFIVKSFTPLVQAVTSRWGEIMAVIRFVVDFIVTYVQVEFAILRKFWEMFGATIVRVFRAVWDEVKTIVTVAIRIVSDIISIALDLITGHWGRAWNAAKDLLAAVWMLIERTISNAVGIVGNVLASLGGIVVRELVKLPGLVMGALSGAANWLVHVGEDIVRGLINGIGNLAGAVADKLKSVVMSPVNAVKGLLGIGSPSKLFHGFGVNLMEGLANGIGAGARMPTGAMGRVAGSLSAGMAGAGGGGYGGVVIHQHIAGSVITQRDLDEHNRQYLDRYGARAGR